MLDRPDTAAAGSVWCSQPRSTRGLSPVSTRTPTRGPTPRTGPRRHADGRNNITTYLVSASLILLVIRQIREHPLDARSLATPVLAVAAAAVMFLHSVPAGGSDLALEAACVAAGATMGAIGGLATPLRLGPHGRPPGPARALASRIWLRRLR